MSAKSLAQLAVNRDMKPPGQSVVKDSSDVLVAMVPSEALAAYTAVIGIVLAANIGSAYGAFRWSAYGAFVALAVLAPIVLFKRRTAASDKESRTLPILECLTVAIAAAAWGLVMPGSPLTTILKGNASVFATTAIVVGAAAVIGLASQRLGTANSKNPVPKAAGVAAVQEAVPAAAQQVIPAAAQQAVPAAAQQAVPAAAQEPVPAAAQETVPAAAETAVPAAVQETVPAAAEQALVQLPGARPAVVWAPHAR